MKKRYTSGFVAVIGRPNVGKSTLINQITQNNLSIVSHKPQTTRHQILAIHSTDDGQIIFIDTPGIHNNNKNALNRKLNQTALASAHDVDAIIFIVDSLQWTDEDLKVCELIKQFKTPVILVINKVDKIKHKERLLPHVERIKDNINYKAVHYVSALKNKYIEELVESLYPFLPESEPHFDTDQISTKPTVFFVAEMIREQLTVRYHEELPYSVTVEIESFKLEKNMHHIHAVIWVERTKQKHIIIGKQGQAIKQVGIYAREQIENFLGTRVNLKLWVKVKSSWTDDQRALDSLGYSDEF